MKDIEFRDGWRTVPDHVEVMVIGLDTYKMTYEEAIKAAEKRLLDEHMYKAQQELLRSHFEASR